VGSRRCDAIRDVCRRRAPALPTSAELLADLPLTDAQRQQVMRGELVTRTAHTTFEREIAVSMAFLMNAPIERAVELLSEAGVARADPDFVAFGEIHDAGTTDDFKTLQLIPHGSEEVQHYLMAHPGETLNLDIREIAAFDALANDAARPAARVEAQVKEHLLARHRAYRTAGLDGIAPYARADNRRYQPADDLRRETDEERVVRKYLPKLAVLLLKYPSNLPPGFRDRFFWLDYAIDDRPNLVLAHRMVVPLGTAAAVVTRQFYVSHSYNVGRAMMDKEIAAMFTTLRGEAAQKAGAR
jgi:hypothetical protein